MFAPGPICPIVSEKASRVLYQGRPICFLTNTGQSCFFNRTGNRELFPSHPTCLIYVLKGTCPCCERAEPFGFWQNTIWNIFQHSHSQLPWALLGLYWDLSWKQRMIFLIKLSPLLAAWQPQACVTPWGVIVDCACVPPSQGCFPLGSTLSPKWEADVSFLICVQHDTCTWMKSAVCIWHAQDELAA